jgi:hypothetical protein
VLDLIYANAGRALPVTQEIQHGPEQSRSAEFDGAIAEAANLGATTVQSASMTADLKIGGIALDIYTRCPGDPPPRSGWQRDTNTQDRLTNF